jgi:NADPH:quinone reductase-like Zn-dependent oxidoreductase
VRAYEVTDTSGLDGLVLNTNRPAPAPGPGQIAVRMRAAALNARDHGVTRGIYGYTKFPVIPLSDGAGEITAVGAGVTGFKVGDRVASTFFQTWTGGRMPTDASRKSLGGMLDGVLAEEIVLPQQGAIHIPDHLSFAEAATLPCAALTAWHALVEAGGLKAGDTVAIIGTGGVSCFAVQFAKMHQARVFLTSSSDAKRELARGLGADVTINYQTTPDWEQAILRQTGNVGVDHVIEVGGANTLEKSMAMVRPGGSIYVIGTLAGAGQINPRMINRKAITLRGIHVGSRDMFANMNRAIAATGLRPVIDKTFAFADARQAYDYQAGGTHFGKIAIAID